MDIKNIYDAVIFTSAALSLRDAILDAISKRLNLSGAVLRDAVLRDADLRGAVLRDAVLSDADLSGADLSGAVLRGADLSGAVLRDAVLSGAVLSGAVLRDADLSDAVLRGAVLRDADLSGAVLSGAVLSDADLRDAVLRDAVLRDAKIKAIRVYAGLYRYQVWAVLFEDGSRWVRMGCLFKSLEQWEAEGGILVSNTSEFPDDGSDKSLERKAAFEFARAAALMMK